MSSSDTRKRRRERSQVSNQTGVFLLEVAGQTTKLIYSLTRQRQGCHSPTYKSLNCKNDETIIIKWGKLHSVALNLLGLFFL